MGEHFELDDCALSWGGIGMASDVGRGVNGTGAEKEKPVLGVSGVINSMYP